MNTACCVSRVSFIDGDRGVLRYRGYPIEQLATPTAKFEETVFLLLHGELPTQPQLNQFAQRLAQLAPIPQSVKNLISTFDRSAHPMAMMMSSMAALGGCHPGTNPVTSPQGQDIYKLKQVRNKEAMRAIAASGTIAAAILRHKRGQAFVEPDVTCHSFTENFLNMLNGDKARPQPAFLRALEVLFITHAEHELNCSTAAARHLSSANADIYTSFAGAIGALYGPRHGGANEAVVRMLQSIQTLDQVPGFIARVKSRKERLMGFGHRIYKSYDPRVRIVRQVAEDVFAVVGKENLIEVARQLEETALSDEFFISRRLYPNVDFYSGLIYKAMGFPSDYFTVLFAVPRAAGWAAHWNEFQTDPDNRIARPLQLYKGPPLRRVPTVDEREMAVRDEVVALE
eukprot:GHVN01070954.1.p1 GENE.GHVN01070954.1~~GHVN01070954.1.p1  ORF type:complete len:465 (+),score=77.26 GHVN01070954.1:201-1397(+)